MSIDWPRLWRALTGQPEPVDIPELVSTGMIDSGLLYNKLLGAFPDASIYLPDLKFNTAPISELQKIVERTQTKYMKYIAEDFDCDDFAWRLMGMISIYPWSTLPFGTIWTNKHALNIYVDDKLHIWFVEPQSWAIKDSLESWQGERVQLLVM